MPNCTIWLSEATPLAHGVLPGGVSWTRRRYKYASVLGDHSRAQCRLMISWYFLACLGISFFVWHVDRGGLFTCVTVKGDVTLINEMDVIKNVRL